MINDKVNKDQTEEISYIKKSFYLLKSAEHKSRWCH